MTQRRHAAGPLHRAIGLDFYFSFETSRSGGGLVTGVVRGLWDDATGPATSLEVFSNLEGFGVGEYIGNPVQNRWTIIGGEIVAVEFLSLGVFNSSPAVTASALKVQVYPDFRAVCISSSPIADAPDLVSAATIAFTPTDPAAPGPLPVRNWIRLTSLGAQTALRPRRAA